MAEIEKELRFTVLYRGKSLQLKAPGSFTLGDLGKEIVDLTGVAPHTLRLMLPKRPPLLPTSEQHKATLLYHSGITEGARMTMMGVSSAEVAAVSQPSGEDRVLSFTDAEQRIQQRSRYASGNYALPKGNYIFCDFQTLQLPGIKLNPPAAMALKIMHKLASDRGITAIMNKYRWRVGVMTEMAPVGYVGISPKCILGFNKNRGQEISMRLRTDDLKGFRKYESIKKTLLHELAHMVHDEHDEKFHALDKQLNEEAITLDWTKSHGHTLSGVKFEEEEEETDAGGVRSSRGYKLGGNVEQARSVDARTAAATAALRRLGDAVKKTPELGRGESSQMTTLLNPSTSGVSPGRQPGLDELQMKSMVVIAEGDADGIVVDTPVRSQEPDPDEDSTEHVGLHEQVSNDGVSNVLHLQVSSNEPDPDEATGGYSGSGDSVKNEPDPDAAIGIVLEAPVRSQEPDPDEASCGYSGRNEPDPDESMDIVLEAPVRSQEPDPDEASCGHSCRNEPDPDEAMDIVRDAPVRSHCSQAA